VCNPPGMANETGTLHGYTERDRYEAVTVMNHPDLSIADLLAQAANRLGTESARLEAEILLAACLDKPRSYLFTWPERRVSPSQRECFESLVERRAAGEPVAHLLGRREFWSLSLTVTPRTLVPRPETETLVGLALDKIPADRSLRIADLGTGTGAIALAIARERPRCDVIATDISAAALSVAAGNAARLGLGNVRFVQASWCRGFAGTFDIILSNPPYVAETDPHLGEGDLRFEPPIALAAGPEGMDAFHRIVPEAHARLRHGGWLLLEHGYDQGDKVARLMETEGFRDISDHPDVAGLSRVAMARR
jgi:release factor glutamine methyltransferase